MKISDFKCYINDIKPVQANVWLYKQFNKGLVNLKPPPERLTYIGIQDRHKLHLVNHLKYN